MQLRWKYFTEKFVNKIENNESEKTDKEEKWHAKGDWVTDENGCKNEGVSVFKSKFRSNVQGFIILLQKLFSPFFVESATPVTTLSQFKNYHPCNIHCWCCEDINNHSQHLRKLNKKLPKLIQWLCKTKKWSLCTTQTTQ